jgi:hypothetical protein
MKDIDEQYLLTLTLRDAGGQRQVYYKDNRVNETAYVEEFLESGGMTLPEDQKPMSMSTFGKMAADVPAGLAKGAIQGTVGIGGDIESLVYGVREIIKRGAGESALDAFIRGLESDTILPKTEEIKKWLDTNIGQLIPAGEIDEERKEAAKVSEFVGELGGAGKTVTAATKAVARSKKALTGATAAVAPAAKEKGEK